MQAQPFFHTRNRRRPSDYKLDRLLRIAGKRQCCSTKTTVQQFARRAKAHRLVCGTRAIDAGQLSEDCDTPRAMFPGGFAKFEDDPRPTLRISASTFLPGGA